MQLLFLQCSAPRDAGACLLGELTAAGTKLFLLLSICVECPAARLAAMSMLRWWFAAMLALPGSSEGRPAGLPRCC